MGTRLFRWLFLALLGTVLVASLMFGGGPQTLGASASRINGRYEFAGGTAPWALVLALLDASLYLALLRAPLTNAGTPMPGILRRFFAFWLDFMLAMFVLGPILGLLPLFVEWHRTGVFAWTFARTTPAPSDTPVVLLSMLITLVALLFYYAVPLLLRRPSPGACIAGYQVLPEDDVPLTLRRALLRTIVGLFAVCTAYLAPFIARDRKQGKFWLDRVFGTQAALLR